ncbi:MAG: GIY-YIG nuclease family protein [Puniceicoccaceae bacterium]
MAQPCRSEIRTKHAPRSPQGEAGLAQPCRRACQAKRCGAWRLGRSGVGAAMQERAQQPQNWVIPLFAVFSSNPTVSGVPKTYPYYYVYILRSIPFPKKTYIGYTTNLSSRLDGHNSGNSKYTRRFRPWEMETVIRFRSKELALAFESYLKSHSGNAF